MLLLFMALEALIQVPKADIRVWDFILDASFYLQLRSFYLRIVFFTCSGGTVSKHFKDQTQFTDGDPKVKKNQTDFPR